MFRTTKTVFGTLLRYFIFSLLAFILKGFIGLPLTNMSPSERFRLTSGWYFVYATISVIVLFYLLLFLWTRKHHPHKNTYIANTKLQRESETFNFKSTYKDSLKEVAYKDLWVYALFSAFPTISCTYAWLQGSAPQALLTQSDLVEIGFGYFRVPHAFFDAFLPLKQFSIPIGILINLLAFWLIYALIFTLAKRNWWNKAAGIVPSHTLRIITNVMYVVVILYLCFLIFNWYAESANWYSLPPQ